MIPVQMFEILGFWLNSVDMTVKLTKRKLRKIKKYCNLLLEAERPTIRQVAQVVCNLVATEPGVPATVIYYKRIKFFKAQQV